MTDLYYEPDGQCIQENEDCNGPVEPRMALSGTGIAYERCEHHWTERLDREEEIRQNYPDSDMPPAWFDPANAGEHWDYDY